MQWNIPTACILLPQQLSPDQKNTKPPEPMFPSLYYVFLTGIIALAFCKALLASMIGMDQGESWGRCDKASQYLRVWMTFSVLKSRGHKEGRNGAVGPCTEGRGVCNPWRTQIQETSWLLRETKDAKLQSQEERVQEGAVSLQQKGNDEMGKSQDWRDGRNHTGCSAWQENRRMQESLSACTALTQL